MFEAVWMPVVTETVNSRQAPCSCPRKIFMKFEHPKNLADDPANVRFWGETDIREPDRPVCVEDFVVVGWIAGETCWL
jgi:hypothetical protein